MTNFDLWVAISAHDGNGWYVSDKRHVGTVEIDLSSATDEDILDAVGEAMGFIVTGATVDDSGDATLIGIDDAETGEPWLLLIEAQQ